MERPSLGEIVLKIFASHGGNIREIVLKKENHILKILISPFPQLCFALVAVEILPFPQLRFALVAVEVAFSLPIHAVRHAR
jgi:hypothetical protein